MLLEVYEKHWLLRWRIWGVSWVDTDLFWGSESVGCVHMRMVPLIYPLRFDFFSFFFPPFRGGRFLFPYLSFHLPWRNAIKVYECASRFLSTAGGGGGFCSSETDFKNKMAPVSWFKNKSAYLIFPLEVTALIVFAPHLSVLFFLYGS